MNDSDKPLEQSKQMPQSDAEKAMTNVDAEPSETAYKSLIKGVGSDANTITTPLGGRHSDTPFRMDLLPPHAILKISEILKSGAAKYNKGDDEHPNWRLIPLRDHLNHALIHITAYLADDKQENHLAHAGCRILFAVDLLVNPNRKDGTDGRHTPQHGS